MDKITFIALLPEIFISSMASLLLLVSAFAKSSASSNANIASHKNYHNNTEKNLLVYYLALFTLIGVIICISYSGKYVNSYINFNFDFMLLEGAFVVDSFTNVLKILLCVLALIVFIYSRDYLSQRNELSGEYLVLSLFSVLGAMVLLSSGNFLTIYLGLELLALPLYALLALHKTEPKCAEAAMKYFIMGALGSGLLLYGISLLYGITGNFEFSATYAEVITEQPSSKMAAYFAMVFILAGVGFKLGIVPFQMWVPDVYEGAITSLTLFIGTVTKVGAFALAYRILSEVLLKLTIDWQPLLLMMAILSIGLGSIAGIAQTNLKRLLAYSTIAHFGFIALGLSVAPNTGFVTAAFYLFVYTLMPLGAFGVMLLLSYKGFEAEHIQDLRGLAISCPWLAVLMALFMLAMAGIPPTVGFYAKFLILRDLISADHLNYAVVALVCSVMAAFYYLRVIKVMFFNKPREITVNYQAILWRWPGNVLLYANGAVMLLLGVFPGPVLYLFERSFSF